MRYFRALPEGAPHFCARKGRLVRKVAGSVEVCARKGRLVRKVAGSVEVCARKGYLVRKVAGNVEVCARKGRLCAKLPAGGRRQKAGGRRGVWSVDKLWGK